MKYKDTFLDGALYEGKSIRLIIEKMFDDYNKKLKEMLHTECVYFSEYQLISSEIDKLSKEVMGE